MGRKADKRAARLAAALDREWWVTAAQCWVHVGEAIRYQTDPADTCRTTGARAMRTIMMSLVLAAMSGCATVGSVHDHRHLLVIAASSSTR